MIEVRGLTKYYGAIPAIQDVTFQVEKGEIVGFLGPNGAGKSTTIKILTCYMPASAGVARIDGLDCFEHSLEVRKRIGYLPETVPLYTEMTVRRFLQFSASSKGILARQVKKEVERVVEICGLKSVAHRIIGNLSKGYRQRVGLAQALIGNPPVIILDEPTIGLDPAQIVEMRNLIRSLAGEHTVFLSSHILPEVAQTCQRVVIINKGRIVATDTPERLTQQLQTTKQIRVALDRPADPDDFQRVLSGIDGVSRVFSEDGNPARWIIETDQSREVRPVIARVLVEKGYGLMELKSVDLSLEEVFMHLVTEESSQEASAA